MSRALERPTGVQGILADVGRLAVWLHIAFVLLTVASAVRYVDGHGLGDDAPTVLTGAALLLVVYAAYPRRSWPRLRPWAPAWCLVLVVTWFVLVLLAPSFSWVAVPLSFVALQVLPFAAACAVVAAMMATVVVAWTRMQGDLDPTIVLGPACVAVLAVVAYRALDREAAVRQELLDELQQAQGDLADAQHSAGALAERARLSREIHDSVAQGLSSINLLLQAAEQDWTARPKAAREHVGQAALTARDGLEEVRRVVRDLAPAELSGDQGGTALPEALRLTCERALSNSGLHMKLGVHGEPVPVSADLATAVLRTARGALANVVEHAAAANVAVSLTYQPDLLTLDVRDDGCGFDPDQVSAVDGRGRGLAGIRSRVAQFGGELVVESAPGEGTALAVSVPLADQR
jgi:signal transduction histidine kinase